MDGPGWRWFVIPTRFGSVAQPARMSPSARTCGTAFATDGDFIVVVVSDSRAINLLWCGQQSEANCGLRPLLCDGFLILPNSYTGFTRERELEHKGALSHIARALTLLDYLA